MRSLSCKFSKTFLCCSFCFSIFVSVGKTPRQPLVKEGLLSFWLQRLLRQNVTLYGPFSKKKKKRKARTAAQVSPLFINVTEAQTKDRQRCQCQCVDVGGAPTETVLSMWRIEGSPGLLHEGSPECATWQGPRGRTREGPLN